MGRIFFTGEHTSERFSGYVHGGYLAGEYMLYLMFLMCSSQISRVTPIILLVPCFLMI